MDRIGSEGVAKFAPLFRDLAVLFDPRRGIGAQNRIRVIAHHHKDAVGRVGYRAGAGGRRQETDGIAPPEAGEIRNDAGACSKNGRRGEAEANDRA